MPQTLASGHRFRRRFSQHISQEDFDDALRAARVRQAARVYAARDRYLSDLQRTAGHGQAALWPPGVQEVPLPLRQSPQLAYVVDSVLLTLPAIPLVLLVERTASIGEVAEFLVGLAIGVAVTAIFTLRDGIDGRSPGKRLTGVQVVDADTGAPISFGQSFRRNWWFLLGQIPVVGGLISLALVITVIVQMNKGPRLGDQAARTRVIWRRYADSPVFGGHDLRCRSCGYDLTGNTSGRCPECGAATGVPTAVAVPPVA